MALKDLFRKKTVQDILKQVEKNNLEGHEALGKHLTTKDLTAFGIAAIVGKDSLFDGAAGRAVLPERDALGN